MKGRSLDDAALLMAETDTVATALEDLETGRTFDYDGRTVELTEDVEFGHKFALEPMAVGEDVYKYGEVVGEATQPIEPGEWVHTHNVESKRGRPDAEPDADAPETGGGA